MIIFDQYVTHQPILCILWLLTVLNVSRSPQYIFSMKCSFSGEAIFVCELTFHYPEKNICWITPIWTVFNWDKSCSSLYFRLPTFWYGEQLLAVQISRSEVYSVIQWLTLCAIQALYVYTKWNINVLAWFDMPSPILMSCLHWAAQL